MYRSHVLVCGGTGCTSSHSAEIIEKLEQELKAKGLENEVKVIKTGCFGLCALGPVMIVYPEGCFYSEVKVEDVPEIVEEHLLKGRMVKRLLYEETVHQDDIKPLNETNFYKKQHRVALRNCGVIDPENIEEYIAMDGYQALAKCLTELTPDEVIQIVKDSGLRGRGGGGFPTGLKWSFTAKNTADQKYVVCNADEGDPGAFMDRSVLEGDPHCIVEAMTICGYATGATEGYVYVRAEYPIAVHRLDVAIKEAREAGLLGKNIFNSGFDFDLHIRLGAGAFVCGEETALMTSIEGNRAPVRRIRQLRDFSASRQQRTMLKHLPTFRKSFSMVQSSLTQWVRRSLREPRYSLSAERSITQALLKFRWVQLFARSLRTSAAEFRTAKSLRLLRQAVRPADVFLLPLWTHRLTMITLPLSVV